MKNLCVIPDKITTFVATLNTHGKHKDSMYTEEDRKIANDVLGFIRRNTTIRDFEMYREMSNAYKRTDDAFSKKVRATWTQLVSLGLVDYTNGVLTLTADGMDAYDAEGGIQAYFEGRKKSKKKDDDLKDSTIWKNRWTVAQIIITTVSTLTGFSVGALLGYLIGVQE